MKKSVDKTGNTVVTLESEVFKIILVKLHDCKSLLGRVTNQNNKLLGDSFLKKYEGLFFKKTIGSNAAFPESNEGNSILYLKGTDKEYFTKTWPNSTYRDVYINKLEKAMEALENDLCKSKVKKYTLENDWLKLAITEEDKDLSIQVVEQDTDKLERGRFYKKYSNEFIIASYQICRIEPFYKLFLRGTEEIHDNHTSKRTFTDKKKLSIYMNNLICAMGEMTKEFRIDLSHVLDTIKPKAMLLKNDALTLKLKESGNTLSIQVLWQDDELIERGKFKFEYKGFHIHSGLMPDAQLSVLRIQGTDKMYNKEVIQMCFNSKEDLEKYIEILGVVIYKMGEEFEKGISKAAEILKDNIVNSLIQCRVKEPVIIENKWLKLEAKEDGRKLSIKVLHQDDNVIKRGEFKYVYSNGFTIKSEYNTCIYTECNKLGIKGTNKVHDAPNKKVFSNKEDLKTYLEKLKFAVKEMGEEFEKDTVDVTIKFSKEQLATDRVKAILKASNEEIVEALSRDDYNKHEGENIAKAFCKAAEILSNNIKKFNNPFAAMSLNKMLIDSFNKATSVKAKKSKIINFMGFRNHTISHNLAINNKERVPYFKSLDAEAIGKMTDGQIIKIYDVLEKAIKDGASGFSNSLCPFCIIKINCDRCSYAVSHCKCGTSKSTFQNIMQNDINWGIVFSNDVLTEWWEKN